MVIYKKGRDIFLKDMLVTCQTGSDMILADILVKYIKGRDLWKPYW